MSVDPRLHTLLKQELRRQQQTISLIASENIASDEVLDISSSVLSNKYAEGTPRHRYYAGNGIVDLIEQLAIDRVKKLFHSEHANVQPHSGANANFAVFQAFLKPGDCILSLDLQSGGHLSMGHRRSFSGQWFTVVHYGVDVNGFLDLDQVEALARKHKPKMIISGASAYPREIDFRAFGKIAKKYNAVHLADISHIAGLVAVGVHQSPVPYADVVTFTTHKTLRGPRGAVILCTHEHRDKIDRAIMPGTQGGPLEQQIAAKAQAFAEALRPNFRRYQEQVVKNSAILAATLQAHGLKLSTDGTDNHLLLADVSSFGLTGGQAQDRLEKIGIITNKNLLPGDTRSPLDPSGLRLGTPSVTTRGFREREIRIIADLILQTLTAKGAKEDAVAKKVASLAKRFPIYPKRAW